MKNYQLFYRKTNKLISYDVETEKDARTIIKFLIECLSLQIYKNDIRLYRNLKNGTSKRIVI